MAVTKASVGAPVPDAEVPAADVTRVVMLAHISGTRDGADWPPVGCELEVSAQEAADLFHNHLAEPASEPVEIAPEPEPEPEPEPVVEPVYAPPFEPEPEEAAVLEEAPPEKAVVSHPRKKRK